MWATTDLFQVPNRRWRIIADREISSVITEADTLPAVPARLDAPSAGGDVRLKNFALRHKKIHASTPSVVSANRREDYPGSYTKSGRRCP